MNKGDVLLGVIGRLAYFTLGLIVAVLLMLSEVKADPGAHHHPHGGYHFAGEPIYRVEGQFRRNVENGIRQIEYRLGASTKDMNRSIWEKLENVKRYQDEYRNSLPPIVVEESSPDFRR